MCFCLSYILKQLPVIPLLTCVQRLAAPVSTLKVTCENSHVSLFYLISLAFPRTSTQCHLHCFFQPLHELQLIALPAMTPLEAYVRWWVARALLGSHHTCGNDRGPVAGVDKFRAPCCPQSIYLRSQIWAAHLRCDREREAVVWGKQIFQRQITILSIHPQKT